MEKKMVDLLLVQSMDDPHYYYCVIVPFGEAKVGDLVDCPDLIGCVVERMEYLDRDDPVVKAFGIVTDIYEDGVTVYRKSYAKEEEKDDFR